MPSIQVPSETYRSTDTARIGTLAWEITDCASGSVIGRGSRDLQLQDLAVISKRDDDGTYYDKRIDLDQGFYIYMAEFPEATADAVTGFALVAGRDGEPSFSWEWFDVESPTHASKIQESGALEIAVTQANSRWEITRTRFLSDVSLRVHSDGVIAVWTNRPRWRIRILQGSDVQWPVLTAGNQVVAVG